MRESGYCKKKKKEIDGRLLLLLLFSFSIHPFLILHALLTILVESGAGPHCFLYRRNKRKEIRAFGRHSNYRFWSGLTTIKCTVCVCMYEYRWNDIPLMFATMVGCFASSRHSRWRCNQERNCCVVANSRTEACRARVIQDILVLFRTFLSRAIGS